MDSLIFISPFVNKFLAFFQYIFVSERKATLYNLLLLVLGIVVTSSLSVRKCFRHVASRLSDKSLNSFYYLLSDGKISLNVSIFGQHRSSNWLFDAFRLHTKRHQYCSPLTTPW